MHTKLKQYFEAQEKLEAIKQAKADAEKQKIIDRELLDLNLYDKVYCTKKDNYDYWEYDEQTGEKKYFRKEPIDITDEEYERIKKYTKKPDEKPSEEKEDIEYYSKSSIGFIQGLIVVALVIGIIVGWCYVFGAYYIARDDKLLWLLLAFVVGAIFIWEILKPVFGFFYDVKAIRRDLDEMSNNDKYDE